MSRLNAVLELLLIVAVLAVGVVVWRADQRARDANQTLICIDRAQATATTALLTPADSVDKEGRIRAVQILGKQIDNC